MTALYDSSLTDINKIFSASTKLNTSDQDWLHHLIADWSIIADLGYTDLELVISLGDKHYIYVAQCRPSTKASAHPNDLVGQPVADYLIPAIDKAVTENGVFFVQNPQTATTKTSIGQAITAVRHGKKVIGAVIWEANLTEPEITGRYEESGIKSASQLFSMISYGKFPYQNPVNSQRHNPHVADGFIVLNDEGKIENASPNAISCFKRLGYIESLKYKKPIDVVTSLQDIKSMSKDLLTTLQGNISKDALFSASNGSSVTMRTLPLLDYDDHYKGAVILCRDVTELHRRDQELRLKDAAITEVHHRVKNNLQSVSALLRLQARKTTSEEVKRALAEAQRRVQTIAILHEGLSKSVDEMLNFDTVLANLLRMSIDVASSNNQEITISYIGHFGKISSQDATPLSLVLSELVTNAVEHGFQGRTTGHIIVSVERFTDNLNITVEDDGRGIPHAKTGSDKHSGLGTQIIDTFVKSDFGGDVKWEPRSGGGTRVAINLTLRTIHE